MIGLPRGLGVVAGLVLVGGLFVWLEARAAPPPGRFTVDEDTGTTVIDNVTGLVWQRVASAGMVGQQQASMNCQFEDGGGAGWRLPSVLELSSIVDEMQASPAIDPEAFPDAPSADFWSSTYSAATANAAWYVNFADGSVYARDMSTTSRYRCVRGP